MVINTGKVIDALGRIGRERSSLVSLTISLRKGGSMCAHSLLRWGR